ncbi:unnamed protein product, partial [Onchocerca flexuosa]|uniref:RNA-dependent RNA polymerase n=1 Tax=Onchocerca flexuosa TaxID=387005 RepID=A0A183HWC0_9BILA
TYISYRHFRRICGVRARVEISHGRRRNGGYGGGGGGGGGGYYEGGRRRSRMGFFNLNLFMLILPFSLRNLRRIIGIGIPIHAVTTTTTTTTPSPLSLL